MTKLTSNKDFQYKRLYGTISGYTTTYNAAGYPFEACIKSMLGFCNEVVVVDGCSTDGTLEKLEALAAADDRVKIHQHEFDWEEPGMDGLQKAYARAMCDGDYLWQMDADEVVHENDYEKIKLITKRFPKAVDILHLPVIELWGDEKHATGRRHCWKWRMLRNKPEITHGINNNARVTNPTTGKVYAKKGMSDGCEYVNSMTYEMVPHTGFYNEQVDLARIHNPERFAEGINDVFQHIPSVWHTSWMDIPRKVQQLQPGGVWDKMWSLLYNEQAQCRWPTVDFNNPEQVTAFINKLKAEGGEETDRLRYKFPLTLNPPKLLTDWIAAR
jgi:glycosyltransferase involved in cell wall biosynthesis